MTRQSAPSIRPGISSDSELRRRTTQRRRGGRKILPAPPVVVATVCCLEDRHRGAIGGLYLTALIILHRAGHRVRVRRRGHPRVERTSEAPPNRKSLWHRAVRAQNVTPHLGDVAEPIVVEWDKLRDELYGRDFTQQALLALLPDDWVVADLGCGSAAVTAQLAAHVKQVIAVDQSAAMLKAARKRLKDLNNVKLVKADLQALPLDDQCCDAALLLLVLTYLEQALAALIEAARILKPGGKLIVVDLLRHDRDDFRRQMGQCCLGYECEQMKGLLVDAALTDCHCRHLPPQAQAKGPALILATAIKE